MRHFFLDGVHACRVQLIAAAGLELAFFFFFVRQPRLKRVQFFKFFLVSTSFRWYRERNTPNGDKNRKATTYK